jgi:mannose/cellobiose epimerase-like protein (N-acyl-D-glucosamine 2-epimerase family)
LQPVQTIFKCRPVSSDFIRHLPDLSRLPRLVYLTPLHERLWRYAWQHFVDHEHGAWLRILGPDNRKLTSDKSPAGKVDTHPIGACLELLDWVCPPLAA